MTLTPFKCCLAASEIVSLLSTFFHILSFRHWFRIDLTKSVLRAEHTTNVEVSRLWRCLHAAVPTTLTRWAFCRLFLS